MRGSRHSSPRSLTDSSSRDRLARTRMRRKEPRYRRKPRTCVRACVRFIAASPISILDLPPAKLFAERNSDEKWLAMKLDSRGIPFVARKERRKSKGEMRAPRVAQQRFTLRFSCSFSLTLILYHLINQPCSVRFDQSIIRSAAPPVYSLSPSYLFLSRHGMQVCRM